MPTTDKNGYRPPAGRRAAQPRLRNLLCVLVSIAFLVSACGADATVSNTIVPVDADATQEPAEEPTEEAEPPTPEAEEDPADEASEEPTTDEGAADDDESADPDPQEVPAGPVCGIYIPDEGSYTDDFEIVDCAQPHDSELAGEFVDLGGNDSVRTPENDVARAEGCGALVAGLTGRPATTMGVEVGIDENRTDGSDVIYDCWARFTAREVLTGSLTESPLEDVLAEGVLFLADEQPGGCYEYADDESYDLVLALDCDDPEAQGLAGSVELAGDSAAFDTDEVTNQAWDLCDDAYGDDYTSIIYPDERGWTAGQRAVYCMYDYAWARENASDIAEYCAYTDEGGGLVEVVCTEPHNVEFVGIAPAVVDTWPETDEEVQAMLLESCRDIVTDFYGRPLIPVLHFAAFAFEDYSYGDPVQDDDVECFVRIFEGRPLTGYIPAVGIEAALGELQILADLEAGTCFEFYIPDFYELGYEVDCTSEGAVMALGTFIADDRPYPGTEALRVERGNRCGQLLEQSGLAADPASVTGTLPGQSMWGLGIRLISCEATPL